MADTYRHTAETDVAEFSEAVRDRENAGQLIAEYEALRAAVSEHVTPFLDKRDNTMTSFGFLERLARPAPFDLTPFQATLSRLPAEFAGYIQGAVAYHDGDWDTAIAHFAEVLELPAEDRPYRSTWAAFMLGKCWTRKDPAQAGPYFERTRAFADEGFRDSLALAEDSAGWQAYAAMSAGAYVDAVHRYAEFKRGGVMSLRVVCRKALAEEPVDPALVEDGLTRRIMTAWLVAYPRQKAMADNWLAALDAVAPQAVVAEADRIAWLSYNRGAMEAARRWLDHAEPDAPCAQWIRAKLLLREGNLEEGSALLGRLAETFPKGDAWRVESPGPRDGMSYPAFARGVLREDLGFVLLRKGDYERSLYSFLSAGDWTDAVCLAERVLTPEEVEAFLEAHSEDPALTDHDEQYPYGMRDVRAIDLLRRLLARRWARIGDWERALPYYSGTGSPKASGRKPDRIPERAREVIAHLDASRDTSQPARSRAEHLFELGHIIREDGPELISPWLDPGRPPDIERFDPADCPPDLPERLEESLEPYPRRDYFLYVAADLMWECAALLPDNDVLAAHALYLGGTYLKNKDAEAADRFYKALVRRNPNLLIARQADDLRWFPKEFTDVVLYHTVHEPWYGRKRNLAAGGMALAAVVGIAISALRAVRRTRARTDTAE